MKNLSLAEQTAISIQEKIVNGDYTGGLRLPEVKLAKECGVSRSTTREALLILERKHLVDIVPNKGAIVCLISPTSVHFLGKMANILFCSVIEDVTSAKWAEHHQQGMENSLKDVHKAFESSDPMALISHIFEIIEICFDLSLQQGNRYLVQISENILPCLQRDLLKCIQLHPEKTMEQLVERASEVYRSIISKDIENAYHSIQTIIQFVTEMMTNALIHNQIEQISINK